MDVDVVLSAHHGKFKTTEVSKEVDLDFDLGHLMATDLNNIDIKSFRLTNLNNILILYYTCI